LKLLGQKLIALVPDPRALREVQDPLAPSEPLVSYPAIYVKLRNFSLHDSKQIINTTSTNVQQVVLTSWSHLRCGSQQRIELQQRFNASTFL
jgi:hypothetical protein